MAIAAVSPPIDGLETDRMGRILGHLAEQLAAPEGLERPGVACADLVWREPQAGDLPIPAVIRWLDPPERFPSGDAQGQD